MLTNPRVVFERLLGGDARTPEERLALARSQASILDSVAQETDQLKKRLGGQDLARLDGYLAGIRNLSNGLRSSRNRVISRCYQQTFPREFRILSRSTLS